MSSADPRDLRIAQLEELVGKLLARVEAQDAKIAEQGARIVALEAENAELKARLAQNSSNSSKPPSSDPPGTPRGKQKPTGRKPGGQSGHGGTFRELLPVDEVDELIPLVPARCGGCAASLRGRDDAPLRHQVTELPPITPFITEYQCHALTCARCGTTTRAALPAGVHRGAFGVRLTCLVALLTGRYRLSKRMTQELLSSVLGVELALGSVSKLEQQMSGALEKQVEEARSYVREQDIAHLDETGWREALKKAWLWVAVTTQVTVFLVSQSRGSKVAKQLLGEDFTGFLVTDRWSAYGWADLHLRQLCWSHLERDFQGFVDRGGEGGPIGEALLKQKEKMFEWWHRVRDGTLKRDDFMKQMREVEREVGRLLRKAAVCTSPKTAGMAAEILKLEPALWTFTQVEGLEPTNNAAERAIRPAVLWRKGSFGTHSAAGSRFVERMLTVVATLRQQKRHVLEHLTASYDAYLRSESAPSLLPPRAISTTLGAA